MKKENIKKETIAEVKYKTCGGGKAPEQGLEHDFGTDLYLKEDVIIIPTALEATTVGVGIHTEFDPLKYGMLVSLRSSMSKAPVSMANHIGVIEGTYRGEIMIPLRNTLNTRKLGEVNASDKVLTWDERSKKLEVVDSKGVSTKLHEQVYDILGEEIELIDGDDSKELNKLVQAKNNQSLPKGTLVIKKGSRVAQVYLAPKHAINWVETKELSETRRGTGGFGSTNK